MHMHMQMARTTIPNSLPLSMEGSINGSGWESQMEALAGVRNSIHALAVRRKRPTVHQTNKKSIA
jgi:hypothetical protein